MLRAGHSLRLALRARERRTFGGTLDSGYAGLAATLHILTRVGERSEPTVPYHGMAFQRWTLPAPLLIRSGPDLTPQGALFYSTG